MCNFPKFLSKTTRKASFPLAEFESQQRMLDPFAAADQKIYQTSVLPLDSTTLQTLNLLLSDAEDTMKLLKLPL